MHGHMRLRPWEIRQMTMGEVGLALNEDLTHDEAPEGGTPFSLGQEQAIIDRYRAMTPSDHLNEARES